MALYPVPAGGYNGINPNLFPFAVQKELNKEYVSQCPLYHLIGTAMTSPIVRKTMLQGAGLQYRVGKLSALDYKNPVLNFDQRAGGAMRQKVDYDSVDVDFRTFAVEIAGMDILKLGTPIDLPAEARDQLVDVFSRSMNYDLFRAMTSGAYPALMTGSALTGNVAGNYPSYDRIVFPIANGTLITRAGYQANGTFSTLVNGMQTPAATTYTGSGLSVKHLETLRNYAERGNAEDLPSNTESEMQPASVKSKAGWPIKKYIYLAHPQSLLKLFTDPAFANSTINRGTVTDQANTPEMISGADYIGEFRGIAIYSCGDLFDYSIGSQDNTKRVAWNIFMGAGAMSIGWSKETEFGVKYDDYERIQTYYGHEMRGQKMLKFPGKYSASVGAVVGSNPSVEQGIIHSFVSF